MSLGAVSALVTEFSHYRLKRLHELAGRDILLDKWRASDGDEKIRLGKISPRPKNL
jgi:hypothetical protein